MYGTKEDIMLCINLIRQCRMEARKKSPPRVLLDAGSPDTTFSIVGSKHAPFAEWIPIYGVG